MTGKIKGLHPGAYIKLDVSGTVKAVKDHGHAVTITMANDMRLDYLKEDATMDLKVLQAGYEPGDVIVINNQTMMRVRDEEDTYWVDRNGTKRYDNGMVLDDAIVVWKPGRS